MGLTNVNLEKSSTLLNCFGLCSHHPSRVSKVFFTGRSGFAVGVSDHFQPDFHVPISPSNNGPEISRFIALALENALENHILKGIRDKNSH